MADEALELDEPDPHSLLFLSCDLVGSTSYKQKKKDWQQTFLSFYRDFPQALATELGAAEDAPTFTLWKAVGDELIFTVRVVSEEQIVKAVRLWLAAMKSYEVVIAKEGLATKGSAFIATFPGPDSESSIPLDPKSETSDAGVVERNRIALRNRDKQRYLFDYFGPSIDTGFRVAGQCDQRYFTLSVEVVWAIARARQNDVAAPAFDDVRLLGSPELKGVWNGRKYPLFAIDRAVSDPINKAMNELATEIVDAGRVADLCDHCSRDKDWPSRLYLPESSHPKLREKPGDSLEAFKLNYMDGAETVPEPDGESSSAEPAEDAPLT
jgi:hypothetical protein